MSPSREADSAGLFFDRLRQVLNNFHDPQWLGKSSPLAAPYFLGSALADVADAHTVEGRGRVLQQVIREAADSLWDGSLPDSREALETAVQQVRQEVGNTGGRYHFYLLDLRYLRRYFRSRMYPPADSEQAIRDYMGVGRGPYFNHLKAAREALGAALITRLQPTFRLEQPPHRTDALIGRDLLLARCLAQLQANQSVAVSGMGGVGKTALAAVVAAQWPQQPVFWFTFLPNTHDQLSSLLFSLASYLHQRGANGLWLQLIADDGKIDNPHLALELARGDLHTLEPRPLLCLDEVDRLTGDPEKITPSQQQTLSFIEGLRKQAPLLLVGQQVTLLADAHHSLEGLTQAQTQALLSQSGVPFAETEAARLHAYTGGNARMLWLVAALCKDGRSLTAVLDSLPETAVFQALLTRLWQLLSANERRFLRQLAVFRNPAPEDAFGRARSIMDDLVARHILQRDSQGAISLLPLIRDLIYEDPQRLPAEERERAHLRAARIRAERSEHTAAAYHFVRAGEAGLAVQVWFPYRQQEVKRGQARTALAIFEQLSPRRLPEAEAETLALIKAELYQLTSQTELGLAELEAVEWQAESETAVQAHLLQGTFLNALGYPKAALEKLEDGVGVIARLLEQLVRFRQQRTLIHIQQWQMPDAIQEARLAQYTAEHLQGLIQEYQGNYDEAYLAYHRALALARSIGYEAGMAQTNRDLATVLVRQSRLSEARVHLQASLDYYEAIGDRLSWEKVRNTLGAFHFQSGEFEQMIAIGEETLPFFEQAKMPYYVGAISANLAESYYETGNLSQAEFYAQKVLSLEETHPYPYALYTLGLVRRAQRRLADAETYLRQCQETAAANADGFIEAYALRQLGEVLAEQGRVDEAGQSIRQALHQFESLNIPPEIEATKALLVKL